MTSTIDYPALNGATLQDLEDQFAAPINVIRTPWPLWNDACGGMGGREGLAMGWHILIAGGSGVSKTFTALNMAAIAAEAGEVVTFHSLEMRFEEVSARVLPMMSGQPGWRIAPGKNFSRETFHAARERIDMARGEIRSNKHEIRVLSDLLAGIKKTYEENGSRFHVVDYLQLAWTKDATSQYDRISEVSHEVRAMARGLGIVTVGLSQLNRAGNGKETPTKEAMLGSSSLENDADQVVVLDHTRKRQVLSASGKPRGWIGWMVLDKNRHGQTNVEIPVAFDSDSFRIRQRMDDEILSSELAEQNERGNR